MKSIGIGQMTVYVFPGQGSQSKGMGTALFDQFPELLAQADKILGYSLKMLCIEDPQQQLNLTQFTQPALFTVNALYYYAKTQVTNETPSFVAGHSLGEYNALLAAGVINFETGLQLVKKRGELMSQAKDGAMAAIVGLEAEKVESILKEHFTESVNIANYNSYTQVVISGKPDDINDAKALLEKAGAKLVVPLKVSGAFHSPFMYNAQQEFKTYLQKFQFAAPKIKVIANCTAQPYTADNIIQNIGSQITHSVRWTDSIKYLLDQGETDFVEVGPGTVLTGLIRRIKNGQ